MHILLLHQHFRTPEQGGGIRSYHVAKALSESGHRLTVLTAGDQYELTDINSHIRVIKFKIPYDNSYSFFQRVLAFYRFYRNGIQYASSIARPDWVYAISTPLSVGWLGLRLKRKWKCKLLFEVGDLWPEVPIALGVIRSRVLKEILYRIERKIYEGSDQIIALSPGIASYIQAKVAAAKVSVIPNMSDLDAFRPAASRGKRPFTIGYFGTLGKANHISYLLEAAAQCQQVHQEVTFIIMGMGAELAMLQHLITEQALKNVQYLPHGSIEEVSKQMVSCDAIYVSFLPEITLHTGSPNKFFDGLAAGKMIIHNLTGWIAELVEQHALGFGYDPVEPNIFPDLLEPYIRDRDLAIIAGKNARELAENVFDKSVLCSKIVGLID